jgi:hypothetical protein
VVEADVLAGDDQHLVLAQQALQLRSGFAVCRFGKVEARQARPGKPGQSFYLQ